MSNFDVITVTKRLGWENIARQSLANQTLQPHKWIVVSEHQTEQKANIPEAEVLQAPPKKYHSNLSASDNAALRACSQKYVIFWQDYIELQPDTFEKLVAAAEKTGGFVTTATVDHEGNFDARYTGMNGLREIIPEEWETNMAIAPFKALKELGGFDEEYDKGWAWDNCSVAARAAMLGYTFYIDESIQPKLHYHPKEPELDPTLEMNAMRHEMTMAKIRAGKLPIKLPYL